MIWFLRQMSAIFCSSSLEKTLPTGLSFECQQAVILEPDLEEEDDTYEEC